MAERPLPAYDGDEPYVFVSYSHEDDALVYPEIRWLQDQGFNIWYDEGISPGSTWRQELAESLKNSDLFLLFVTPASATSDNCLKEVNYALDEGRGILPIHLESTELPEGLKLSLSDRQAILKHELPDGEYREKVLSGVGGHIQRGQSFAPALPTTIPSNSTKPILIGAGLIAVAIITVGIFNYLGPSEDASVPPAIPQESQTPSIAVLSFLNMSSDPEQDHFADGLSEEILNNVVKLGGFTVASRTSAFAFKGKDRNMSEIAKTLKVDYILEGSVRKSGNQLRITAQLIDTATDRHIWSETYNQGIDDQFLVQAEVSKSIVEKMRLSFRSVDEITDAETEYDAALRKIRWLIERQNYTAAFVIASQLEKQNPDDPVPENLWELISDRGTVLTEPLGADVRLKDYRTPEANWIFLGKSPLNGIRLPRGHFRLKLEKDGHTPFELVTSSPYASYGNQTDFPDFGPFPLILPPAGTPKNMSFIPGRNYPLTIPGFGIARQQLEPFFVDRYEVSNKKFQEFVDQKGYVQKEYWEGLEFAANGHPLTLAQALAQFVDTTGEAGPANWEVGHYPSGKGNYPVTGISWYEAVAYSRFSRKELPTIYHWAAAAYNFGNLNGAFIPLSNFSGLPAPVGSSQSLGPLGTYDMAGNVREWVWNQSTESNRWALGGAWSDEMYMSTLSYAQPAMTRDDLTGFRLIQHVSPGITKDELVAPLKSSVRDYSKETPVSDEVFNVLREQLTYERGNLNAVVESVDESNPSWTKEKVLINTGYDKERFPIYIFKPKSEGPHEVVIYFWGLSVFMSRRSNDELEPMWLDFIINSGRSLVVPVYAGSFERYMGFYESSNEKNSDPVPSYLRQWRSDLGRTLDYLETRNDVGSNFAYLGFSFGASTAVPLLAIEERFKAAVLVLGGLSLAKFKTTASDPFNYISRIKLPVLMLNGRYDHFFPSESSSLPFFNLLGTPIADKRQVLFDTGHLIPSRSSLVRETVEWLDKYQGK